MHGPGRPSPGVLEASEEASRGASKSRVVGDEVLGMLGGG